jgi:outer membrane protein assembly factor BamE
MTNQILLAPRFMRAAAALPIASALLGGCSALDGTSSAIATTITPYRAEVVQGNVVTKEQVEMLKPGLTHAQVKLILGTPLVTSVFHESRWDYVFTINRQGVPPQQRKLTLFFAGDALEKFNGDEMPSNKEFIDSITQTTVMPKPKNLKASAEELERARQDSSASIQAPAALPAAPKIYPPLESGVGR